MAVVTCLRCSNTREGAGRVLPGAVTPVGQFVAKNVILVVANTDPLRVAEGMVNVQTDRIGIPDGAAFSVTDLLDGRRYAWRAGRNYVRLDPARAPAHIFAVTRS